MKYVLIAIYLAGKTFDGEPKLQMSDFDNKQACERVREIVLINLIKVKAKDPFAECQPKG